MIGGVIGNAVIVATLLSLVSIVFAVIAYGVSFPAKDILPTVVTIALAAVCFCALGVAVSSIVPNVDAAPARSSGWTRTARPCWSPEAPRVRSR